MKMNEIKQRSYEIARDSVRKEKLVNTGTVMDLLPDVLESLSVDKNFILKRIEDELRKPSVNPLNAVLNIFGLRIIRTERTISTIDGKLESISDFSVTDIPTDEASSNLIRLNEEELSRTTDAIARKLAEFEKNSQQTADYLKEQNVTLHTQLESTDGMLSQLRMDFNDQLKTVAERVQYILSLQSQGTSEEINKQLTELLTDLDLKAIWHTDLQDDSSQDAMFSCFKYAETKKRKEKPCILHNGQVLIKGVIFVNENTAE